VGINEPLKLDSGKSDFLALIDRFCAFSRVVGKIAIAGACVFGASGIVSVWLALS
jgi:hypothetical protein